MTLTVKSLEFYSVEPLNAQVTTSREVKSRKHIHDVKLNVNISQEQNANKIRLTKPLFRIQSKAVTHANKP